MRLQYGRTGNHHTYRHTDSGAGRTRGEVLWTATARFPAYVDAATGDLKQGEGYIVWPLTEKDVEKRKYFRCFKKFCIYHLRVRELMDKTAAPNISPSFYNRFSS